MQKNERQPAEYTSSGLIPNSSYIEIFDSHTVVIDGCRGVIVCSETLIRLSVERRAVVISGDELVITKMNGQTVFVSGNISAVEFV